MAKKGEMHSKRIFKEPKELEDKWNEYKVQLKQDALKWEKIQYVGKDGERREDYPKLPLTLEGFKRHCWNTEVGNIEQYFTNQDKIYNEFIGICSRVKNEIREDQITGGLLGFYNPSITQRLNSLTEKVESTITEKKLPDWMSEGDESKS